MCYGESYRSLLSHSATDCPCSMSYCSSLLLDIVELLACTELHLNLYTMAAWQ